MVNIFIRGMLGTGGSAILDFYLAHSFWINGLILLYALLIVLARRSFEASSQLLIRSLQSKYGPQFEKRGSAAILKILKKMTIPWDQALGNSSFPFLTPPGSIWIYPRSPVTLQKFLTLEQLAERLAKS